MAEPAVDYTEQILGDINTRIRDLEEKQRGLKDRTILIGKNLLDIREETNLQVLEIKKQMQILKEDISRIKSFIESVSGELSKFARKEDIEILTKQAKMFQPLEFVRKSELERLKVS
ncbi:MAG TPA: hypothetical protein VJH65_01465 [Candidatus Nanoarchaeia archaeon]|nr:hypothetical protein [Candidatus Nanoarchaeia archaeon]